MLLVESCFCLLEIIAALITHHHSLSHCSHNNKRNPNQSSIINILPSIKTDKHINISIDATKMKKSNTEPDEMLFVPLDVEEGQRPMAIGDSPDEDNNIQSYYNPALRFLMAVGGIPVAFVSLFLIMFSPVMFVFMHDDPSTYEFPGNVYVIIAFIVYILAATIIGLYSYALLSSAIRGATIVRLPRGRVVVGRRWASPTCGIILLIPAIFILTAYLISNIQ